MHLIKTFRYWLHDKIQKPIKNATVKKGSISLRIIYNSAETIDIMPLAFFYLNVTPIFEQGVTYKKYV